jgi:hypothetical protein
MATSESMKGRVKFVKVRTKAHKSKRLQKGDIFVLIRLFVGAALLRHGGLEATRYHKFRMVAQRCQYNHQRFKCIRDTVIDASPAIEFSVYFCKGQAVATPACNGTAIFSLPEREALGTAHHYVQVCRS